MMENVHVVSTENRGFANARNNKLRLLAKRKRSQPGQGARDRSRDAQAGSPQQRQRVVRLSDALKATPHHFDACKVACVEQGLTVLDELPAQYHAADVVYLSKNNLQTLQGIEQFSQLRVLSAADNLLKDISELQILQDACSNLQVASFERNPICHLPNYRNKVIQMLPKLQMLDGQGVSSQDRQRAAVALQQEAACMAVMMSNACMVHKLVRTAELLQLHTELRKALFGSASILRKSFLPSAIPLDLLKFLKLWDYEGSLTDGDRRIISDALTRETVRVHKQLQHAALQLKGPAQLPELQAWDAAFSQVMLAQQRTIIQLVELVNGLHDEAAKVVAGLTACSQGGSARLHKEEQDAADQQHQLERERLIVDLRDAALELAGVLASNSPRAVDPGTAADSPYIASPMKPSSAFVSPVQQKQPMVQQAQQQLDCQLQQWSPSSQQHEDSHHSAVGTPQQQQSLIQSLQSTPTRIPRLSGQVSSHQSLRLRPMRTSAPAGMLMQQQQAAARIADTPGSSSTVVESSTAGRVLRRSQSRIPKLGQLVNSKHSTHQLGQQLPPQQQVPDRAFDQLGSSVESERPLSPTARKLLQRATAAVADLHALESDQQHYLQQQQVAEDSSQLGYASSSQELLHVQQQQIGLLQQTRQDSPLLQQQAEWMEAGFASDTPQGPRSSIKNIGQAAILRSSGSRLPMHHHQSSTETADADLFAEHQQGTITTRKQRIYRYPLEQRQSSSTLSLPASNCTDYDQQQGREQQELATGSPVAGSPTATSILQVPEGLAYLTHNNIVYERIERFTPAKVAVAATAAESPAHTHSSPAAVAAGIGKENDVVADDAEEQVDVSAMIAAAQSVARRLFAVEEVPGACGFYSPYPTEAQPPQLQHCDNQQIAALQSSMTAETNCQHPDMFDVSAAARGPSVASVRRSVAGEISFACGKSSTASPQSLQDMHESCQEHCQLEDVVAKQQQITEQQQQLLWSLLDDSDPEETAESPSAAAAAATDGVSPDRHQPHLVLHGVVQDTRTSESYVPVQKAAPSAAHAESCESYVPLQPTESPVWPAAAGAAAVGGDVCLLSRGSSVSSSGDLSVLRQQLFASVAVPSPAGDVHAAAAAALGSRASGLVNILAQQQPLQHQQQQRYSAVAGADQHWPQQHRAKSIAEFSASDHPATSVRVSGKLENLSSPQQQQQQLRLSSADCLKSPRGSALQLAAIEQPNLAGQPQLVGAAQQLQQLLASTAAGDASAGVLDAGTPSPHVAEQNRLATAECAGSHKSPRTSTMYLAQPQQQPETQHNAGSDSASVILRPSIDQQPAVAMPVPGIPTQTLPASLLSARQSPRGATLEDWSLQPTQQQQQQQTASVSSQSQQHAAVDVTQSNLAAQAKVTECRASAVHQTESPVSRCSSRASMVDVVAQTLGHGGITLPTGLEASDYLGSQSAGVSPRGSLAIAAGTFNAAARSKSCCLPPISVAEAAAVVTAAVQAASGSSRPTSPRPLSAEDGVGVGRTSQVPSAVGQLQSPSAAVTAVRQSLAAAAHQTTIHRSSSPSLQLQPLAVPSTVPCYNAAPSPSAAAQGAAAASVPATPTKKVLAELQNQLVMLVVEKTAMEKQLQLGMGEIQHLQQEVAVGHNLKQTVQHMQADLLTAQEQLQRASCAAQQQAEQNHQLLLQMQQLETQLATRKAQQAQAESAEKLSDRALSRRILLHYHQAAQASVVWRQLKAAAVQHRQQTVTKAVFRSWQHTAWLVKGLRALEDRMNQRLLRVGFSAWVIGVQALRFAAQQKETAYSYWYGRLAHKVLCHWRYYTHQVKVLGVEPPSSPSTASVSSDLDQQWQQREVSFDGLLGEMSNTPAAEHCTHGVSRASLPSITARLGPLLGRVAIGRGEAAAAADAERVDNSWSLQQQQQKRQSFAVAAVEGHSLAQRKASTSSSFSNRHASRCSRRTTVIGTDQGGLPFVDEESLAAAVATAEPLAASPLGNRTSQRTASSFAFTCSSEAHPRCSSMQLPAPASSPKVKSMSLQQQQQRVQNSRVRSATVCIGASEAAYANSVRQPSKSLAFPAVSGRPHDRQSASVHQSTASVGVPPAADVPADVHLAFIHEAKAQRLRRRWLIRKTLSRWQQFLQVQAAHAQDLAAADRYSSKRRLRRTWRTWQDYIEQQQHDNMYPDGLDHTHMQLLQQHSKLKQRMLLLRAVQAWWAVVQRAIAARTAAEAAATRKRRQMLRGILRVMQQKVQYGYYKQQLVTKAEGFRYQKLLHSVIKQWWQAVLEARAVDPLRNEASKQILWKAVLRWHLLSVQLAAAASRAVQVESFKNRMLSSKLSRVFTAWRMQATCSAREQWRGQLQQAKQQVVLLQQQLQDEQQQHGAGIKDVRCQMQQLQQQLQEALTDKQQLQEELVASEQLLQQQAQSHQQQISQMLADHKATVSMLQQKVEQAARTTDETADQLEQLQQQQSCAALEQQQKQQLLQQQDLVNQQQRQQQLEQREQELQQQLATSKSQGKQLASQLKRCSEKLEQQTQAVQKLQHELDSTQQQVAAARHSSRDQNLSLTHQALAAQQEKLELQQQLCKQNAAVQVLKQQMQGLEQQLQHQKDSAAAAAADHVLEVEQLRDMIGLKEQVISQMQENAAAVQGQLASQQAKVLVEVDQLRKGWSQAKQIIKQQRRTIKAQDLQLQLALASAAAPLPAMNLQQQQQKQQFLAAVTLQKLSARQNLGDLLGTAALAEDIESASIPDLGVEEGLQYPITAYVLQQQQQ